MPERTNDREYAFEMAASGIRFGFGATREVGGDLGDPGVRSPVARRQWHLLRVVRPRACRAIGRIHSGGRPVCHGNPAAMWNLTLTIGQRRQIRVTVLVPLVPAAAANATPKPVCRLIGTLEGETVYPGV
jgi:hypothetical protein